MVLWAVGSRENRKVECSGSGRLPGTDRLHDLPLRKLLPVVVSVAVGLRQDGARCYLAPCSF